MAFNPSPKVRAAADIAKEFGKQMVVVLMVDLEAGTLEYASYGKDPYDCARAKKLAETAYDASMRHLQAEHIRPRPGYNPKPEGVVKPDPPPALPRTE